MTTRRSFLGAAIAALAALVLPKPKYALAIDWAQPGGEQQCYEVRDTSYWVMRLRYAVYPPTVSLAGIRSVEAMLEFNTGGREFCLPLSKAEAMQISPAFAVIADVLRDYKRPDRRAWFVYLAHVNPAFHRLVHMLGREVADFLVRRSPGCDTDFLFSWMLSDLGALFVDHARGCLDESPRRKPWIFTANGMVGYTVKPQDWRVTYDEYRKMLKHAATRTR